jgi:outer membrane receptor protein involved in Fe transport
VGRGFRAPNLVERFFEGPTPEGTGYEKAAPDLDPETSVNVELGARWRAGPTFADAFAFRNEIRHGIALAATGDTVAGLAAYRNVNVDRLRHTGLELLAGTTAFDVLTLTGSFTRLIAKNVSQPELAFSDTYSSKLVLDLAYRSRGGRVWAGYTLRHEGEQKDVVLGENPIGPVLPAFTVHQARAGIVLTDRGPLRNSLALVVDNLTNRLYAELSNASFFRPEPRRSVGLSFITEF